MFFIMKYLGKAFKSKHKENTSQIEEMKKRYRIINSLKIYYKVDGLKT